MGKARLTESDRMAWHKLNDVQTALRIVRRGLKGDDAGEVNRVMTEHLEAAGRLGTPPATAALYLAAAFATLVIGLLGVMFRGDTGRAIEALERTADAYRVGGDDD